MADIAEIVNGIYEKKFIAILRGLPEAQLIPVGRALYEGGVRLIECTFDHTREDCVANTAHCISALTEDLPNDCFIGAGTVLTSEEVDAVAGVGGEFVISPGFSAEVVSHTRELGMVSIPGAFTPSEIAAAWNAGANFVKLFPANVLGTDYIKAIRAPLRHIPLLAVGGVTPESIPAFRQAGICGFGVGGPLLPKEALAAGDWAAITARARAFIAAIG